MAMAARSTTPSTASCSCGLHGVLLLRSVGGASASMSAWGRFRYARLALSGWTIDLIHSMLLGLVSRSTEEFATVSWRMFRRVLRIRHCMTGLFFDWRSIEKDLFVVSASSVKSSMGKYRRFLNISLKALCCATTDERCLSWSGDSQHSQRGYTRKQCWCVALVTPWHSTQAQIHTPSRDGFWRTL